jgi:hypothetical protein
MQNSQGFESIGVINQKNTKPKALDPSDLKITIKEYMVNNGKKIPKDFTIEVDKGEIHITLNIETLNSNYVKLPLLSYWRFHLKIEGTITAGSVTEEINNVGIAELMKFSRIEDSVEKNIDSNSMVKPMKISIDKLDQLLCRLYEKIKAPLLKKGLSPLF